MRFGVGPDLCERCARRFTDKCEKCEDFSNFKPPSTAPLLIFITTPSTKIMGDHFSRGLLR